MDRLIVGLTKAFDSRLLSGIGVLATVVEAGSFVRAAESLGLTQSGVSRAVARLERRVGVRLFDRTARAIALTEEGRSFASVKLRRSTIRVNTRIASNLSI
jgi:DNA-binding MarR family transcriptional regulator